ncbi:MAG: hypothetical protein IPJ06_00335 [Saprospiraceae bacterium]|nr:hypothetical protein [Saprospiraceae bacterium]
MCTFYRALILWCLLSISGGAWTQTSKVYTPSVAFTKRDGLDQNQVVNLVEDKFGRIWIGTQNGISVFDGRTVRSCGQDRLKLDGAIRYLNIDGKREAVGSDELSFLYL